MHVLVTGGTGLVGRFIVRDLIDAGHRVTLLSRTPPPAGVFPGETGFMAWRLGEPVALPSAAALVHAAFDHVPGAYRGGEGGDPQGFWKLNFDGTLALFEAARAAGVSRAVFLSSRAVYGEERAGAVLRESDRAAPGTLYGQLKRATEEALEGFAARGLAVVSLRATGVYGRCPGWAGHKWQGLFADYLSGAAIEPRVATEVHGQDLAAAVRLALASPEAGMLNVSDLVLDWHDLLALVQALTGCGHPLPRRSDPAGLAVMATDRLRGLGWRPGGWARLDAEVRAVLGKGAQA